MHRPAGSLSPLLFGRRTSVTSGVQLPVGALSQDARLFLLTYAAGFLVVSFFIA